MPRPPRTTIGVQVTLPRPPVNTKPRSLPPRRRQRVEPLRVVAYEMPQLPFALLVEAQRHDLGLQGFDLRFHLCQPFNERRHHTLVYVIITPSSLTVAANVSEPDAGSRLTLNCASSPAAGVPASVTAAVAALIAT